MHFLMGDMLSVPSFDCFSRSNSSRKGLFPDEPDNGSVLQDTLHHVDLDALRSAFTRYAGPDARMDETEYCEFVKAINLPSRLVAPLWSCLDADRNGIIDMDEFCRALDVMSRARQFIRYCPDCQYSCSCDFCMNVVSNCEGCSDRHFCARCWSLHPGRIENQ